MDILRKFVVLTTISLVHLTSSQNFEVANYNTGPGLYYEHVGEASIYVRDFNIITYYDLNEYFLNHNKLMSNRNDVEKLCKGNYHQNCANFLNLLDETHMNIDHKHELITDILEIRAAVPARRKRFWGGLLTTVAKGIFGIVRNRQKQSAVSQDIQKYREDVDHLKNMLNQHMYIYQNLQESVNNQFNKLSSDINQIANDMKNLGHKLSMVEKNQKMTNLLLYASNLIHLFTAEQSDLLDCLILARQGILHPIIMSPTMLQNKLLEAHHRTKDNKIMAEALLKAANNSNLMFNMIKPVIYVENMTIVFDFDVPLITDAFYDIYKLTSAPVSVSENIYAYIYPESPYLFQEKRNQRHFFLDTSEFDKCKDAGDKQYVCKREKPLRSKNITCEHMLIFSGEAMPENCDVRLIRIDETLFIELEREGSWLFTAPKSENLIFYCDQQIQRTVIKDTGIVDVDPSCLITESETVILRDFSTNNMNLTQNFEIFTPKGDLQKYLYKVDLSHLAATMNVRVLSRAETVKLKDIGVSLSSIKMRNQLYSGAVATGHNVLLYALCIVCCALIIFNVYMYMSHRKKTNGVSKSSAN